MGGWEGRWVCVRMSREQAAKEETIPWRQHQRAREASLTYAGVERRVQISFVEVRVAVGQGER